MPAALATADPPPAHRLLLALALAHLPLPPIPPCAAGHPLDRRHYDPSRGVPGAAAAVGAAAALHQRSGRGDLPRPAGALPAGPGPRCWLVVACRRRRCRRWTHGSWFDGGSAQQTSACRPRRLHGAAPATCLPRKHLAPPTHLCRTSPSTLAPAWPRCAPPTTAKTAPGAAWRTGCATRPPAPCRCAPTGPLLWRWPSRRAPGRQVRAPRGWRGAGAGKAWLPAASSQASGVGTQHPTVHLDLLLSTPAPPCLSRRHSLQAARSTPASWSGGRSFPPGAWWRRCWAPGCSGTPQASASPRPSGGWVGGGWVVGGLLQRAK